MRPQAGFYHCFGCNESGDVYSFLRAMDHVSFTEAVERLAGRIGYTLHYEDGGAAPETTGRSRMYAANGAAAEFFRAPAGDRRGRDGAPLPRRTRIRCRRRGALRRRLRPEGLVEPARRAAQAGLQRRGAHGRRARLAGSARRLRPVPRSRRLAHPRRDGPGHRVRCPQALRRRPGTEVPEHPGDRGLSKVAGALRARSGQARHLARPPRRRRRGLHRRDGVPPRGHHDGDRELRHRIRLRPHHGPPPRDGR